MKNLSINKPLREDDIKYINNESKIEDVSITFDNTKGLDPNLIEKLNSNVKVIIYGGLNPKKEKYRSSHYTSRTWYYPNELSEIIRTFEKIERKIDPLWNDMQKAMFVYKTICEFSTYDENDYNGRDAARNLLGMITRKSVCAGYGMIFKEMMDRIGIECFYQNKVYAHAWNVLKIDGKYYAVDLTWDVNKKKANECRFMFFGRYDNSFYEQGGHDIEENDEEKRFPIEKIEDSLLAKVYGTIRNTKKKEVKIINKDNNEFCYIKHQFFKDDNLRKKMFKIAIRNNMPFYMDNSFTTYVRKDKSVFTIIPTGNVKYGINEYLYIEYLPNTKKIRYTSIFSEMDLVSYDENVRNDIANILLSKDRVYDKINNYNGYVGYVKNNSKYYNLYIEQNILNKMSR